jgi:hypothetical protein
MLMITPGDEEKTMDRNFFYQKRAQEHQREVLKELAARHLLGGNEEKDFSEKQVIRLALSLVPVAATIGILLLLVLSR